MDMILSKCKFPNCFLILVTYVVGTHRNCLYEAISMFTYNIRGNSDVYLQQMSFQ